MELAPFPTTRAPSGMTCAVDHLAARRGRGHAARRWLGGRRSGRGQRRAGRHDAAHVRHGRRPVRPRPPPGAAAPRCPERVGSRRLGGRRRPAARRRATHAMPFTGDIRAVPVPGCVDGWLALHERFGRLPLADVLEPAAAYAADGFPASPMLAWPPLLVTRRCPAPATTRRRRRSQPGDSCAAPAWPARSQRSPHGGRAAFYEGEFGEGLARARATASTPPTTSPVARPTGSTARSRVWDHDVWTMPPNSQGYLTLAGALDRRRDSPLPDDPTTRVGAPPRRGGPPGGARPARRAARAAPTVPRCSSNRRLAPRRAAVDPRPRRDLGAAAARRRHDLPVRGRRRPHGRVAHPVERIGLRGPHAVVPATGIFLHNRGIGFSLEPGHPAEYGPGRRPPHTLAPAVVTTPTARCELVIGTMGGDTQPQILLQLLARLLHNGQSPGRRHRGRPLGARRRRGAIGFDTWASGGRVRGRRRGPCPAGVGRRPAVARPHGHAHRRLQPRLRPRPRDRQPREPPRRRQPTPAPSPARRVATESGRVRDAVQARRSSTPRVLTIGRRSTPHSAARSQP